MKKPLSISPFGPFYTTKEAASYLRVSVDYLERLRMSGDGPAYVKLGRARNSKVFYTERDLQEWILKRRHGD